MKAAVTHSTHQEAESHRGSFIQRAVDPMLTEEEEMPFVSAKRLGIQPKLTIGAPNDPYEQEADAMAEHVMRMPLQPEEAPVISRINSGKNLQRMCSECEEEMQVQRICDDCEEETAVQRSESSGGEAHASSHILNRLQSRQGQGSPLPISVQTQMGQSFGTDFSNVRIHTDTEAAQMSQDLNAQAFTHGSDIYFNQGKYDTGSSGGQRLLAHELTHTVQQGNEHNYIRLQHIGSTESGEEATSLESASTTARSTQAFDHFMATYPVLAPMVQRVDEAYALVFQALQSDFPEALSDNSIAFQSWRELHLRLIQNHILLVQENFNLGILRDFLTLLRGTSAHLQMGIIQIRSIRPSLRDTFGITEMFLPNLNTIITQAQTELQRVVGQEALSAIDPNISDDQNAEEMAQQEQDYCGQLENLLHRPYDTPSRGARAVAGGEIVGSTRSEALSPSVALSWERAGDRGIFENLWRAVEGDYAELFEGIEGCYEQDNEQGRGFLEIAGRRLVKLEALRLLSNQLVQLRLMRHNYTSDEGARRDYSLGRSSFQTIVNAVGAGRFLLALERQMNMWLEHLDPERIISTDDPLNLYNSIQRASEHYPPSNRSRVLRNLQRRLTETELTLSHETNRQAIDILLAFSFELFEERKNQLAGIRLSLQTLYYSFPFFAAISPEEFQVATPQGARTQMTTAFQTLLQATERAITHVGSESIDPFSLPIPFDNVRNQLSHSLASELSTLRRREEFTDIMAGLGIGLGTGLIALIPIIGPIAAFTIGVTQGAYDIGRSVDSLIDRHILSQSSLDPEGTTLGLSAPTSWDVFVTSAEGLLIAAGVFLDAGDVVRVFGNWESELIDLRNLAGIGSGSVTRYGSSEGLEDIESYIRSIITDSELESSVARSSHREIITRHEAFNEVEYVNRHPELVEGATPNQHASLSDEHEIVQTPEGCERHSYSVRIRCPIPFGSTTQERGTEIRFDDPVLNAVERYRAGDISEEQLMEVYQSQGRFIERRTEPEMGHLDRSRRIHSEYESATGLTVPEGYDLHHIIPENVQGDTADRLREILERGGIDIHDIGNLVPLPTRGELGNEAFTHHRYIHGTYQESHLNEILEILELSPDIRRSLNDIRSALREGRPLEDVLRNYQGL